MPTFEAWCIVKVPFPYTARPVQQRRPALVVAAGRLQSEHGMLWVLMITSADNRAWPWDVPVSDLVTAGLPAPSVVRCAKLAAIEAVHAERLGELAVADRLSVATNLTLALQEVLGNVA